MERPEINCCCGRLDCAYLQHNSAALASLEKDVHIAARLGQALLGRHESYMAEAEADRTRMIAEIEKLEEQKKEAQAENAKIIQENRGLLDQLEGLNDVISESDAHIKALNTSLESVQLEVRRLTAAASRATILEAQLTQLEVDQARLQDTLTATEENERSAIHRWRQAERTLRDLHEQVEKIEKESRGEREKHAELLAQMERRRTVERELDTAAGRLKGAAATASLGRNTSGTSIVSHFVRDILQDNANLQFSLNELKELLQSSDEEVRSLRDKLMFHHHHQHLCGGEQEASSEGASHVLLSEELQKVQSPSQEFHVHHHYHAPIGATSQRKDRTRFSLHRPQKKRRTIFPTLFESPPKDSTGSPLSPNSRHLTSPSTALGTPPLSTSANHWVDQTPGLVFSSGPSSPRSTYKASSLFDRSDVGFDSSRPTSPESGFASPLSRPCHRKLPSDTSIRSVLDQRWLDDLPSIPLAFPRSRADSSSKPNILTENDESGNKDGSFPGLPILEEHEDNADTRACCAADDQVVMPLRSPQLHRSASHESLLSISGMDIHSTSEYLSNSFSHTVFVPKTPRRIASAGTIFSSTLPVTSLTDVTVSKVSISKSKSPHSFLSSVAFSTIPSNTATSATSTVSKTYSEPQLCQDPQPTNIKSRMGSWILGKWSSPLRPTARPDSVNPSASTVFTSSLLSSSPASKESARWPEMPLFRSPGVNQKGLILGLRPPEKTPISLHPETIDEALLRESLEE
ncbi:hypothetical protein LOZ65_002741 [Ophidiomyces ophidiicola]|nr:hypothetical protein LOZ65_002741 [Ophidiomyces ophidiicola]